MSRLVPALRLLIFIVVASGVGSNSNETSILDAGDDHSIAQYREKMCVMRGRKCNRNRPCCSGICKRGKCRADLTSYANSTQLGSSLDNCAQVLADCRSICAPNKALITCDPKPPCCFCQLPCSSPPPLWWCNTADDVCRNYCRHLNYDAAVRCLNGHGGDICTCYC